MRALVVIVTLGTSVIGCGPPQARDAEGPQPGRDQAEMPQLRSHRLTPDDAAVASRMDRRATDWDRFSMARKYGGGDGRGCISCHTTYPYLLTRPMVREPGSPRTAFEETLWSYVEQRVARWESISAWYPPDFNNRDRLRPRPFFHGDFVQSSRAVEAILNASLFAESAHRRGAPLGPTGIKAFRNLWPLQIRDGVDAGGFPWLDLTLAPFEVPESAYWGSAVAARAAGLAGEAVADAATAVAAVKAYLRRGLTGGRLSLHNTAALLWASAALESLLSRDEILQLSTSLLAVQREDGSFSIGDLSQWKRRIDEPLPPRSGDAYATGFVLVALLESGTPADHPAIERAIEWLRRDYRRTNWSFGPPISSVPGKKRRVEGIMDDASLYFSVMALDAQRRAAQSRQP